LASGDLCGNVASTQPSVAQLSFSASAAFAIVYDLETIMGKSDDINGQVTNAAQS
jgi:hypothetical protein